MSRHRQQLLELRVLDKNGQLRGGARPNAGRPRSGLRASEAHKKRPTLTGREPILVTARVGTAAGSLRRWRIYHAVRGALAAIAAHDHFRVVHISLQRTHLHMLVEAATTEALSRGMQGLLISAARRINRAIAKATNTPHGGTVFPDRYHARVIGSPRQCRNAIAYVLNNWRRHGEDHVAQARTWKLDPMSSAVSFTGWREQARFAVPARYEPLPTREASTWLLRVGWARHGTISTHEVPGPASS
jgi:REP element-mobilizing transposase RayT